MELNSETITFLIKLKYETKPGEEIYIYGDNKDFGNWTNAKFKLSWSKGHIWQAIYKISKKIDYIKFKFVCHSKHYNIWEEGDNRLLSPKNIEYLPKTEDGKYILDCIWGYFKINFNIHYLLKNNTSNMRIIGGIDALSNWKNPIKLKFDENKKIKAKDGNEIEGFWNITFLLNSKNKKNFDFQYRYTTFDENTNTAIWEREPNRHLHILTEVNTDDVLNLKNNPEEYKLLTNSFLQVLDVNFVADFIFNKMGEKNIFIGPYPQNKDDLLSLSKNNINSILNVQSEDDLKIRQINLEVLKKEAKELGIEINHYPIQDFDSKDLQKKLKGAGDLLNDLLKKGKIVYVHCTAGMSRAAATVIIYLVLYEDFTVENAKKFCKKYRPVICPNYDIINKIAAQFKPGSEMLEKVISNTNINEVLKNLRANNELPKSDNSLVPISKDIKNDEYNMLRASMDKLNKSVTKGRRLKSKKKNKRLKSILKHSSSFRKGSSHELSVKNGMRRSITFILDNDWEERNLRRKESEKIIARNRLNLEKKEIEKVKRTLFLKEDKDYKKAITNIKTNNEKINKSINLDKDKTNNKIILKNKNQKIVPKKVKKTIKIKNKSVNKEFTTFNLKKIDKDEQINIKSIKKGDNKKTNNVYINNNLEENNIISENNIICIKDNKKNEEILKNNKNEIINKSDNNLQLKEKKNKSKIIKIKKKENDKPILNNIIKETKENEEIKYNDKPILNNNIIENKEKEITKGIEDKLIAINNKKETKEKEELKNKEKLLENSNKKNEKFITNSNESESIELSESLSKTEEEEEKDEEDRYLFEEKDRSMEQNKNKKEVINKKYNLKENKNNIIKVIKNIKEKSNKDNYNKRSNSITHNLKVEFKNRYLKGKNIGKNKKFKVKEDKLNQTFNTKKRIIKAYDEYNNESNSKISKVYNKYNNKKETIKKIKEKDENPKIKKNIKYLNNFSDSSGYLENEMNNEKRNLNKIKNNNYNNKDYKNNNFFRNNIKSKNNYNVHHYKISKNNSNKIQNNNNNKINTNCKEDINNININYINDFDSSSNNLEINSNYNNYNNDTDRNNTNYNSDEESNTNDNIINKNKINKIEDSYDSHEGKLFKYNGLNNAYYQDNNSLMNKNMKFFKLENKTQYQNKFKYNKNMNKAQYKCGGINNIHNSFRAANNDREIDNESNSERSIGESISESISQSLSESENKMMHDIKKNKKEI